MSQIKILDPKASLFLKNLRDVLSSNSDHSKDVAPVLHGGVVDEAKFSARFLCAYLFSSVDMLQEDKSKSYQHSPNYTSYYTLSMENAKLNTYLPVIFQVFYHCYLI